MEVHLTSHASHRIPGLLSLQLVLYPTSRIDIRDISGAEYAYIRVLNQGSTRAHSLKGEGLPQVNVHYGRAVDSMAFKAASRSTC